MSAMTNNVSSDLLRETLSLLRQALSCWRQQEGKNVIFLNSQAAYETLSRHCWEGRTLGGILEEIACCIPLALTEESLRQFLSSCENPEETLEKFLESSKRDFLLLLLFAGDDPLLWKSIEEQCELLRQTPIDWK
ncbi:hypothetical protein H9X85_03435 [Anaerotignum lactatifermentans]|uniref:hypothetical protein n=1 Tax=Anaerotignum lactatifermentans TaxID=160404 RepID=UPI00196107D0|nr:hypothetical protein [Anaerotignum lactatifermentans]MBM6950265.1 hypothetical protein [Anaerotignum lactatifermentans]